MGDDGPLDLWCEAVRPGWIDFNGHMNVAYYVLIFDHAVDALFNHVGLDTDYRTRTTGSTFTVESHITYDRELVEGDEARCTAQLMDFDEKRIHHYYEMYHATEGYLAATTEFMSLHVDLETRRVVPMPDAILDQLGGLMASHARLPRPENLGRVINNKGYR